MRRLTISLFLIGSFYAICSFANGTCGREAEPRDLFDHINERDETTRLREVAAWIDAGRDIEALGPLGIRPTHLAVRNGDIAVLTLLLNAGANVNGLDNWHNTPLHYAAGHDRGEIGRLLRARGANETMGNVDGTSPLQIARTRSNSGLSSNNVLDAFEVDLPVAPPSAPPAPVGGGGGPGDGGMGGAHGGGPGDPPEEADPPAVHERLNPAFGIDAMESGLPPADAAGPEEEFGEEVRTRSVYWDAVAAAAALAQTAQEAGRMRDAGGGGWGRKTL